MNASLMEKFVYRFFPTVLIGVILSSCSSPHHYKAQLCNRTGDKTYSRVPEGAAYHGVSGDEKMVVVRLQEVYMGQLHRKYLTKKNKNPLKADRHAYAGKELWIIAQAVATDTKNPLLETDAKYVAATSIKLNQESFAPVPISRKESEFFRLPANRDYRITFKVYEVDKFEFKKTLYNSRDTDFGKLAVDTVKGAWGSIENAFLKSVMSTVRKKYSSNLAIEELILAADSSLEFQGSFYLYKSRAIDNTADDEKNYALVDIIRSYYDHDGDYIAQAGSDIKLPPMSNKDQVNGLRNIRSRADGIILNPALNYSLAPGSEHYQSYVKFGIED